jgi:hypothetical protein
MTTVAEREAADVSAPVEDSIWVISATTSASTEQDLDAAGYFGGTTWGPQFLTFISSARFYITFKAMTGVTDPDSTATTTGARTWEVPADQPFSVRVSRATRRFFKVRGSATQLIRLYPSSVGIG